MAAGGRYFGVNTQDIERPESIRGKASTFEMSSSAEMTWVRISRPFSWWAFSRPRKSTFTFTLSPSSRNVRACFTLKPMSCSPVSGSQPNFLQLLLMLFGAFCLLALLLVLKLAEVHDLADRGADVGSDFHQVQSHLDGHFLRFRRG